MNEAAAHIHVFGIVQGVGFRPFVYRAARRLGLTGWVCNAVDGVDIHAEGAPEAIDGLVAELNDHAPAAAQVKRIRIDEARVEGFRDFQIHTSDAAATAATTLVSPDLATCDDCLAELFDPENRRYHYPFINCTNCGPRFTIVRDLPYDRPATSMASFAMCPDCAREYADPLDRRFHAQPDACFVCGPTISCAVLTNGASNAAAAASPGTPSCPSASAGRAEAQPRLPSKQSEAPGKPSLDGQARSSTADDAGGFDDLAGSGETRWGRTREESDAIIEWAASMLHDGKILAVKGLGGFHLVCDAENPEALARLRKRKRRPGKPFAVMLRDVDAVRERCELSEEEAAVIASPARPIVLLRKRAGARFAQGLADGLTELGVMLPATPVQHLLVRAFGGMLVMTSGNLHDEPIQIDDAQAARKLAGIADAIIGNDRPILARYDDSVVRVLRLPANEAAIQVVRRARGYAPVPIAVSCAVLTNGASGATAAASRGTQSAASGEGLRTEVRVASAFSPISGTTETLAGLPSAESEEEDATLTIFATGPEQKNTFCYLRAAAAASRGTQSAAQAVQAEAFVSQHIGDVEDVAVNDAWLEAKATFERVFRLDASLVAHDKHPEYLTSKWAAAQPLPLCAVQHHHAHIVSAMAENGLTGPVCGIAFDGTGFGEDGAIWGGEVLLSNLSAFERFANFTYFPLPGGAAAIKNPLRCAYGALWAFDLLDHPAARRVLDALGDAAPVLEQMVERGLNCPQTSSVGRLFDAASAILGVCEAPTYEGEGAVLLEAAITDPDGRFAGAPLENPERYRIDVVKNTATKSSTALDTSVVLLDAAPLFQALLDDMQAHVAVREIARAFHDAIVAAIVSAAQLVDALYGIKTVVLSGGCFMNRYLAEHAVARLTGAGFSAALNKDLPPNDGCVSLGQAVVAWHARQGEGATPASADV